ncbi:MAG: hypothetical protein C0421_05780 [Hyphomonas sp.]|uniref:hypothetical protein n=1 Tax=Hyphomonas sp. TaxID=87 RepID=UPI0025BB3559|nr:hypothetical protein [Hyphomonas sp.]MBA4338336.1 hypothetical protein [Hyphomonas sp.]
MVEVSVTLGATTNRMTGDPRPCVCIPMLIANELEHASAASIRDIRKAAVREREAWAQIQKEAAPDDRREAKAEVRAWTQRERAATLLLGRFEGASADADTYHWPVELCPALDFVIGEALCASWAGHV